MLNKIKSLFAEHRPIDEAIKVYDQVPAEIQSLVTPFGSRVFGGATKYSDLDLLGNEDSIKQIEAILHANRIKYSKKRDSYTFTVDNIKFTLPSGITVDLSFVNRYSYDEENQAAQILALYIKHYYGPILRKKERIEQYSLLVNDIRNKRLIEPYLTLIKTHAPELLI